MEIRSRLNVDAEVRGNGLYRSPTLDSSIANSTRNDFTLQSIYGLYGPLR
jgi:hypothetical protein